MPDVRPIDATALQNTISEWRKKEMENDNSITGSAIIDVFGDVLDAISVAPTIDIDPRWVSVKDRLPEFEDDEPFIRCIVNVIRWSEGWTGLWNQPEPTLNEEEFTAAATYNPEQKIFTVYDGFGSSMVINALLSPDDGGGESGCRVTHWMENPAPVGFWKKEAQNDV